MQTYRGGAGRRSFDGTVDEPRSSRRFKFLKEYARVTAAFTERTIFMHRAPVVSYIVCPPYRRDGTFHKYIDVWQLSGRRC